MLVLTPNVWQEGKWTRIWKYHTVVDVPGCPLLWMFPPHHSALPAKFLPASPKSSNKIRNVRPVLPGPNLSLKKKFHKRQFPTYFVKRKRCDRFIKVFGLCQQNGANGRMEFQGLKAFVQYTICAWHDEGWRKLCEDCLVSGGVVNGRVWQRD